MSRKTFCDMCGAEIKGNSSNVVAISAEYDGLCVCISRDDAVDACDECYTRIREAIKGWNARSAVSMSDSFEKIAADAVMSWGDYCENYRIDVNDDIETEEHAMQVDLLRRMKAVAARG